MDLNQLKEKYSKMSREELIAEREKIIAEREKTIKEREQIEKKIEEARAELKELRKFQVTSWGKTYDVWLRTSTYRNNNNLYVGLVCKEVEDGEEWYEPFADITVNTESLKPGYAAIDINNFPEAEQFITENKLAKFAKDYVISGFCVYPIYLFDMERLALYADNGDD